MVAMNVWPTDAADGSIASEARWRKMGRLWTPSACSNGSLIPSLAYPNLTIGAGYAWVDGHYCELLGSQVLTVTANGLAVVRFDPAANTAELLYRDGATTPAQNISGTYELPIAKIAGSALTDARVWFDKGGGLGANNAAALELNYPSASWNAPAFGTPAFVIQGLNPHVIYKWFGSWQEQPSLYHAVTTIYTDQYGRGNAVTLPTGAKWISAVATAVDSTTPVYLVADVAMAPVGTGSVWFYGFKHDGSVIANSSFKASIFVTYKFT